MMQPVSSDIHQRQRQIPLEPHNPAAKRIHFIVQERREPMSGSLKRARTGGHGCVDVAVLGKVGCREGC